MTAYFVEHKEYLDTPQNTVFGFVEVDANGARIEDEEVEDADVTDDESEMDRDEEDLDLASEPSPASTFVPDQAFFVRGNPVLIAQTATRFTETTVQVPKTTIEVPQKPAQVIRQEIEVPASENSNAAGGKRVCKDMDARGLLTTYEVAPVSFECPFCIEQY